MHLANLLIVALLSLLACGRVTAPGIEDANLSTPDSESQTDGNAVDGAMSDADQATCTRSYKVFLNRNGGMYMPAPVSDSRQNKSSDLVSQVSAPAFSYSENVWQATVECVREVTKDFDIEITEQDPGDATHFEITIGGLPADLDLPDIFFSVTNMVCEPNLNNVAFVFSERKGPDPVAICNLIAFQIGAMFGLEPTTECPDVMATRQDCVGVRSFLDQELECKNACICNQDMQNSYQRILRNAGATTCP